MKQLQRWFLLPWSQNNRKENAARIEVSTRGLGSSWSYLCTKNTCQQLAHLVIIQGGCSTCSPELSQKWARAYFGFQAITLFRSELLWATREASNRNLQVVVTHALHVCSQHSFALPLRMNGMHRTQFDHSWLDRSCLRSRTFRPMVEDALRCTRGKPSVTQGINDRW